MGYPHRLLSEGEEIAAEFRPHWFRIVTEILVLIGALVLVGLMAARDIDGRIILAVVVVALAVVARGLIRWYTTHHVITNERLIYREGWIAKRGKEIPLEVINDVAFSQNMLERMLGTGDLLIESAGTHGQSRYRDIPNPEDVQTLIYRVREERIRALGTNETATTTVVESTASQLEKLARLHDQGKLTDEEFEREKARLLGGN
ncbi:MAG: PH domain-containing protein [Acidimicrobiia bacterium]